MLQSNLSNEIIFLSPYCDIRGNLVYLFGLFISCYLDLRQRNTVLISMQRITNQGSVDVSCLSLFPTIFKISREHILNYFFSFVLSIGPAPLANIHVCDFGYTKMAACL